MAIPNYVLTVHATTDDYTTGAPFDSVLLTSISGLTGYASATVAIIGGAPVWSTEHEIIDDVGNAKAGTTFARRVFPVKCYPFTFATGGQDIDAGHGTTTTESELVDVLFSNKNLWISVEVDDRVYPSATRVYPVNVIEWDETPVYERGNRDINIKFEHKYLKS